MMTLEKVGSHKLEIEGVRHLGDHESVVYVRHVDGDIDDIVKATGKSRKPVRRLSEKRVLFSAKETTVDSVVSELSDSDVKDNVNNNNTNRQYTKIKVLSCGKESPCSDDRQSIRKGKKKRDTQMVKAEKVKEKNNKAKDLAKSLELYGLSPRVARKHQQIASHNTAEAAGHTVHQKQHHGPHVLTSSIETLGLSPGLKRRGAPRSSLSAHHHAPVKAVLPHSLKSHSMDTISHYSNSSSSEPSPMQSPNLRDFRKMSMPPVPLHLGFISTDEELENLRFIKKALSPNPLLPDILKKLANSTAGNNHLKPPVATGGRRRSVSMDPEISKYKLARDSLKKRVDSAHK